MEEPLERITLVLCDQRQKLAAAAAALAAAGLALLAPPFDLAALAAGATLAALAAVGIGVQSTGASLRRRMRRTLETLAGDDPAPQMAVDRQGALWFANAAARRRLPGGAEGNLPRALAEIFADPEGMLEKLHRRARDAGFAREEVPTRRGEVILTVNYAGSAGFLWRIDEVAGARTALAGPEALPMLTAAPSGAVLFMNEALRRLIGRRVKHIDRILTDLPPRSGTLQDVATAEGPRTFRLAVASVAEGRSEIYFLSAEAEAQPSAGAGIEGVTEDLPVGLLHLRADGTIAGANRLARDLIGANRREEPIGRLLSDWLEGLGRPVGDWLDEAARGRGLGKPEILRVRDTATESFLQVTLGAAGGRNPAHLVAVLNDATELKALQQQFVQSQKMQAIGQLAGGVAHDFNNLLTAISGHCDLMLLRHDQGDPDYADLVQIHQNANRAASLVGQLLAFSRKQTLQPQVIDLRDTLSDLTHLLNRLVGERIKLTLHHEASLPAIRADKRQLEQVLMNLVVNARDAMPEGGEIRIETMERVLGDDLRRDRAKVPAGRYVVVKVEDHGTGIPEDKIGKIFEPFYTTKRQGEGTGLGLSTAYGIVKQSGGFIFVDSVVGSGTVFTLYFPAHDQRRSAPGEATLPPRPPGRPALTGRPAALFPAGVSETAGARSPGSGPRDAGTGDAGTGDAGTGDAGTGDAGGAAGRGMPGASSPDGVGGRAQDAAGGDAVTGHPQDAATPVGPGLWGITPEGMDDILVEPDGASAPKTEPPIALPVPAPTGAPPALPAAGRAMAAAAAPPLPPLAFPDPGAPHDTGREGVALRAAASGDGAEPAGASVPALPPLRLAPQDTAEGKAPAAAAAAPATSDGRPAPRRAAPDLTHPGRSGAAPPQPRQPAQAMLAAARGNSGSVILLVEDEAPVRAFASRALRMRGHVVIEAENAEEALAILEEPDLHIDVFVTDVIMPGMDGPTWVRLALQRRPDVRVVFVSGYAEDSFGEAQARIPNSVFLPKPFSLSELTATVQDQLG